MQTTQSPHMGVNNMQNNAYNKSQYNGAAHYHRAPIYDGMNGFTHDFK